MTPHTCRYCGKLLRTWHEKEAHVEERMLGLGCDKKPERATDDQIAFRAKRDRICARNWDRRKLEERQKAQRDPSAPLTFNPFGVLLGRG